MFGTSGIRGPVGDTITTSLAVSIGRAFPTAFPDVDAVLVGRDPRDSGRALTNALTGGLQEAGLTVHTAGIESTPTIARTITSYDADAGIVITASHNPPTDNGLKFWNPSGQAFTPEQQDALTDALNAESISTADWDAYGTHHPVTDAATHHREQLLTTRTTDLSGLSVIVDLGNGAGRITADTLRDAGADVRTLNGQPDGAFPGRPSEPTADNCHDLCQFVAGTDADLGIAHDGDADRMMAVDDTGSFVSGDHLLALFARDALTHNQGNTIAVPLNTSRLVDTALEDHGGTVHRTRVGDIYVADAAATNSDIVFGGEPSGAWIWPTDSLCPDGPRAALTLCTLLASGPPLSERIASLPSVAVRRESHSVSDKHDVMADIRTQLDATYDETQLSTIDGVRVDLDDGWFLIRASGTESLIRLTAEANTAESADRILDNAREYLP